MCILFRYWEVYALSLHKNGRVLSEWLIRVVACGIRFRLLTSVNTLQPHPILGAVNGDCHILADFFGKSGSKLTPGIELSATDQVGQILLTLMVQTMKKKILAVEAEGLSGNAKCDNLGSDSCFPRLLAIGDAIGPLLWLHSVDWWEGAV